MSDKSEFLVLTLEAIAIWSGGLETEPKGWVGDEIRRAIAEIEYLRSRLEVSDSGYDGISCRNETIRNQDGIIDRLRSDLEKARIQLAACGVIAMSNTPESAAKNRSFKPEYDCASLHDVMGAVDREMALRAENAKLREAGREMADKLTVLVKYGSHHDDVERAAANRAIDMFNAALPEAPR